MKPLRTLLLALATLASPTIALAIPDAVTGSVGNVTFALTFTYTAPNAIAKGEDGKPISPKTLVEENEWDRSTETKIERYYEMATKMATVKYGNKELLQDLIDSGVIDSESPAGWSIIQVTPTFQQSPVSSESARPHFLAIKTGQTSVNITQYVEGMQRADAYTENKKVTTKGPDDENLVTTVTDTLSWKSTLALHLSLPVETSAATVNSIPPPEREFIFELQGLHTGSEKQTTVGTGDAKRLVRLLGPQKISAITGEGPELPLGEEADVTVVEGTISISPGKPVANVTTTYGITLPPEDG